MTVPQPPEYEEENELMCDNVLRKVMSWLEVPDLMTRAALVSRKWAGASACKEVWRRRMHPDLLQLFSSSSGQGELSLGLGPAQLFHTLYRSNLLRNGAFLERANAAKNSAGGTKYIWAPTTPARTHTWEYPLLDADLPPLPLPAARPFSTGCVAATGDWAELVQVVDLATALSAAGLPEPYQAPALCAGIPLTFTCWAHGSSRAPAEYQLVVVVLSDLDSPLVPEEDLVGLPRGLVPFGKPPAEGPGAQGVAEAHLRGLGLVHSRVVVMGPGALGGEGWKQLKIRLPAQVWAGQASRVVVALRGRSRFWHLKHSHHGVRLAGASLMYTPEDSH